MSRLEIRPNVVSRHLGDECVLVDLEGESVFELNATGARVWALIERGVAVGDLLRLLVDEFDAPEGVLRHDVEVLLSSLERAGLIKTEHRSEVSSVSSAAAGPPRWVSSWTPGRRQAPELLEGAQGALPSVHVAPDGTWVLAAGYLFGVPDERRAEHVLAAFRAAGDDFVDGLRGAFVVVVWDPKRDRLIGGRDGIGLCPGFYSFDGSRFLLSTDAISLVRTAGVSAAVNVMLLAEYVHGLHGAHQRSETYYRDVRRVLPAHRMTVDVSGVRFDRYWDPLPRGFEWATESEAASVTDVLAEAVDRCVALGVDALALSGGYDSVSLAILSAQARRGRPPLTALSLRMVDSPNDEGDIQVAVAKALGMPQILREMRPPAVHADFAERALAASTGLAGPVLSPWQWMYELLLTSAKERGLSKVFVGTGGDEMFIVDPAYSQDLIAGGQWAELGRFAAAWSRTSPFSTARVLRELLWRNGLRPLSSRHLPAVMAGAARPVLSTLRSSADRGGLEIPSDIAHAMQERSTPPNEDDFRDGAYLRVLRELPQSPRLMSELDQSEAWCDRFQMRFFYPFFDRQMVDLALRIRPEALYADGLMKTPLRRLVHKSAIGLALPKKKVDFTAFGDQVLRAGSREVLKRMGGLELLSQEGIVDRGATDRWFDDYGAGGHGSLLRAWRLMSAEAWLRGAKAFG